MAQHYLGLIIIISALFFISILNINDYYDYTTSLRESVFHSVSLLTTTGFSVGDYENWPGMSSMLVFVLLFIGGSAGATTGGIKIIRTIVISRYLLCEVKRLNHPNGVFNITLNILM